MKNALAIFAVAAFAAGAHAAPAPKPITGQRNANAPINISSDSFQADLNSKTGTYNGNVVVVQGDTKMRSNSVRISTIRRR